MVLHLYTISFFSPRLQNKEKMKRRRKELVSERESEREIVITLGFNWFTITLSFIYTFIYTFTWGMKQVHLHKEICVITINWITYFTSIFICFSLFVISGRFFSRASFPSIFAFEFIKYSNGNNSQNDNAKEKRKRRRMNNCIFFIFHIFSSFSLLLFHYCNYFHHEIPHDHYDCRYTIVVSITCTL